MFLSFLTATLIIVQQVKGLTSNTEDNELSGNLDFIERLQDWRHSLLEDHEDLDLKIQALEQSQARKTPFVQDPIELKWFPVECRAMNIKFKKVKTIYDGKRNTVYKVEDLETGKFYAYKVFENSDEYTAEVSFMMIADHPNIVKVFCIQRDPRSSQGGIVYEFLDGPTSKNFARTASYNDIVRMSAQLVNVLDYVHKLGFLHADIKPENINVKKDSVDIKVLDFGLALKLPYIKKNRGTLTTISPELVDMITNPNDSEDISEWIHYAIDWWACGSTFGIWQGIRAENSEDEKARKFIPLRLERDYSDYVFGKVPENFGRPLREVIYVLINGNPKQRRFATSDELKFLRELSYFEDVDWNNL